VQKKYNVDKGSSQEKVNIVDMMIHFISLFPKTEIKNRILCITWFWKHGWSKLSILIY